MRQPCLNKTNWDIGMNMKPKPNEAQNPKFSESVTSSFISWMVIEIIKFENQASFVENFGRSDTDDSPAYFVLNVKGHFSYL